MLEVFFPDRTDDIARDLWNEMINPACTGAKRISADGCELSWSGSCPLQGVSGQSHEEAYFVQVEPERIEGEQSVEHDRDDGTRCSTTVELTLTKLDDR